MPKQRFQPYEVPDTRRNESRNMEAGPSTLAHPIIPPHMAPPTAHPSGGTPETTADAETNHTSTEEDVTPVSDSYYPRVPHVAE